MQKVGWVGLLQGEKQENAELVLQHKPGEPLVQPDIPV